MGTYIEWLSILPTATQGNRKSIVKLLKKLEREAG